MLTEKIAYVPPNAHITSQRTTLLLWRRRCRLEKDNQGTMSNETLHFPGPACWSVLVVRKDTLGHQYPKDTLGHQYPNQINDIWKQITDERWTHTTLQQTNPRNLIMQWFWSFSVQVVEIFQDTSTRGTDSYSCSIATVAKSRRMSSSGIKFVSELEHRLPTKTNRRKYDKEKNKTRDLC